MPNAMMPMNLMPLTYSVDFMRQKVLGPLEPLMLPGDMAALDLHRTPTAPP
jgi:hypothetical protein